MMTFEQGGLIGKYYSHSWARRQILRQSDDDIEEQDEQINEEQADPRWNPPMPEMDDGQQGSDNQAGVNSNGDQPSDDTDDNEKIRQALLIKKQMEEKGPKNRSLQDESKYRSALMILAKNKAE